MAFSKAPSQSTYQSKEIKLLWSEMNRDKTFTKDPLMVNGFIDIVKDKDTQDNLYFATKRDGALPYYLDIPSANIRGMYHWEDEDKLYVAYDTNIAVITASTGLPETVLVPFTSTSGDVSFTSFFYEDGTTKVVVGDGELLWTLDNANVAVQCLSADFPTPYKPSLLFLDGYLFVIKDGTSDIYNSNLNDPLAWTAGDFLSAEMLPDTMVRLARVNNYVVAFGSSSIEYFFDAGNASGSPLQRNDTPVKLIGYLGALAEYGNKILFVGQYEHASPAVFILEDFKVEELDTPFVKRALQPVKTFTGVIVSNGGHDFYVLSFNRLTFAIDLETKLWSKWTYGSETAFPITYATQVFVTQGHTPCFCVAGNSALFTFSPTSYQDSTTPFTFQVTTKPYLFDTYRRKFMSRLFVVADLVGTTVQVSYSDNDYSSFSADRSVSLSTGRPCITRLGSFFRRVFRIKHTDNTPCRLHYLEVDFNIGIR